MCRCLRCPPCKEIWPDLSIFLEQHHEEVILLRANVWKAPKLVRDFNIESDSKLVIFRNGKMVRNFLFQRLEDWTIKFNYFVLQLREMDGSSFDELCECVENTLEMGLADSLVSKL